MAGIQTFQKIMIRNIVCTNSFLDSLNRCLPWVFGEFLLLNVYLTLPDLSYETWKSAKMEDFESLVNCVAVITILCW